MRAGRSRGAAVLVHLTFGIRNRAALTVVLGRKNQRLKQAVKLAVLESGDRVQAGVKTRSPVDTGFMRDHVRLRFTQQAFGYDVGWLASDFAAIGKALYAIFVVLGTRFMPARDFLTPAWAEERPKFLAAVQRAVKQAMAA